MTTIWKFVLDPSKKAVRAPANAHWLVAHEQGDEICVWALVDSTEKNYVFYEFGIYGTGHPIPLGMSKYLGTAFLYKGSLVFHIFLKIISSMPEMKELQS